MEDAQATRKKQFRLMVAGGGLLAAMVVGGLYWNDPAPPVDLKAQREKASSELMVSFATPGSQVRPEDKWMADGAKQVEGVQQQQYSSNQRLQELERWKSDMEKQQAAKPPVSPMEGVQATPVGGLTGAVSRELSPPPPPPMTSQAGSAARFDPSSASAGEQGVQPQIQSEIQVVDLGSGESKSAPPATDTEKKSLRVRSVESFLPAGSFATVSLLSGIDAPTGGQAASQALPIVMRVKSFARLPNYYRTNLKECFITANGYGDAASERAFIRTSKMSCVMTNGNAFEVDVKGHLSGEDGSFGMRGKLVSKQGSLIWRGFLAGLFGGIGSSIAEQNQIVNQTGLGTVTTVDPNKAFESGLAQGLSTGANKVADFWIAQANQVFPIIEIAAGRVGEIYLMEGIDFGDAILKAVSTDKGAGL